MKVLLISNMYPSSRYPSYGIFVKNFEDSLKDKNIRVEKIVLTKDTNKIKKVLKYITFYLAIISKNVLKKYDLVYVHYASHTSIPILIANKFKKIKLFTNVHGSDVVPEKPSQFKYQKYVEKMLNISQKIVVPSDYFREVVKNKYYINKDKLIISPSGGINEEKFYFISNKESLRNKYNISKELFIIGYVGRIDIGKGWDTFLRSLKILVDNQEMDGKVALIVGSGAQLSEFNSLINELKLNNYIIHLDILPQSELNNIYNIIDVFCFPTIRDGESLGLVGLEAMMCGVPVIGSKVGALPEYIIENETGKLFEKSSCLDLANKVLELYVEINNNHKNRNRYIGKCITKAKEYESKKVNNEIYDIIVNETKYRWENE